MAQSQKRSLSKRGIERPPSKRTKLNQVTNVSAISPKQSKEIDLKPIPTIVTPTTKPVGLQQPKEDKEPLTLTTQILPPELAHLHKKYDFICMSIISSSKMEQKIRTLLGHMSKFSFAKTNARPGVVVLHAKAPVASKLCSIVEIAKQTIQKEKGQWYQYSRVHGELTELKPPKAKNGGRTLTEVDGEGMGEKAAEDAGKTTESSGKNVEMETEEIVEAVKEIHGDGDGDEEVEDEDEEHDEEAFETMLSPAHRVSSGSKEPPQPRKKIRAVPVLTIYMSRVPIPDLRSVFG
ncbi:hypothetical protein MMC25_007120 [Agyrium rufum]|nr:hypothetical protein [Agyrium rufum]